MALDDTAAVLLLLPTNFGTETIIPKRVKPRGATSQGAILARAKIVTLIIYRLTVQFDICKCSP